MEVRKLTGTLTIETLEANGSPVEQAVISVYERTEDSSSFIMSCYTDENGQSEPIPLPAPNSIHSMHSDPQVCPYAQYDVHVTKEDYDKEVINGVQIFSDTHSALTVIMQCCNGRPPKTNTIDISPHDLYDTK